jgi:hypothetical protein
MLSLVGVPRGRRIVVWAGLAGLAFALGVIGFVLQANGLQDAANVTQLVALVVLVPSMAKGLFDWARQRPADTRELAAAEAERFAGAVADQWQAEARRRSLQHPYPMPVRWHSAAHTEAMDLPVGDDPFADGTDDVGELADRYLRLPARRLVVVGGPGAGKTTLAVRLVLALLERRAPGDPVPVLVSLTGWPHGADVAEWLTARLRQDYQRVDAEALVERRLVVPVLDGFDELPAGARTAVLARLNESMHTVGPLILTSRTGEYLAAVRAADDVLAGAAVVEPEPLTPATAVAYLRAALRPPPGPAWADLMAVLDGPAPPAALAEVASTPLGLWLLRVAGKQLTDPGVLLTFDTAEEVRQHLFTMLIPAVIKERPPDPGEPFRPRHRLDPGSTRTWLETVAVELERQGSRPSLVHGHRDFRWWELAGGVLPRWLLPVAVMTAGLVLGAVWGTVVGLGVHAGALPVPGGAVPPVWTEAVTFGLIGLVLGVVSAFSVNNLRHNQPSAADLRSVRQWMRFLGYVTGGIAAGAAGGVAFQLALALVHRVWSGLFGSAPPSWVAKDFDAGEVMSYVVLGGLIGVVCALMAWRASWSARSENTPVASLAADHDAVLARTVTYTVVGVALGMPADAANWRLDTIVYSGLAWALLALAVAVFTERGPWVGYLAATAYLAARGRSPLRLMTFLDDAHRLGLLRTIGPTYQFRHAELQDHLAAPHRVPPAVQEPGAAPARWPLGWSIVGGVGIGLVLGSVGDLVLEPPGSLAELVPALAPGVAGLVAIGLTVRVLVRRARRAGTS